MRGGRGGEGGESVRDGEVNAVRVGGADWAWRDIVRR